MYMEYKKVLRQSISSFKGLHFLPFLWLHHMQCLSWAVFHWMRLIPWILSYCDVLFQIRHRGWRPARFAQSAGAMTKSVLYFNATFTRTHSINLTDMEG